jgi:hypothetical protein
MGAAMRLKHRFAGYVHAKMVPGAEPAQIERLTALASRECWTKKLLCIVYQSSNVAQINFSLDVGISFREQRGWGDFKRFLDLRCFPNQYLSL